MLRSAAGVDWTVVRTEVEALQLEYSWIKEFDPRFNVRYRDDKSYPYLAVTLDEEYPRVMVMRGAKRRGIRYFGPYSHAWAIRDTVDTLLRVFPVRTCSAGVFKRAGQIGRPCLLGYIGKCSAPCVGRVSEAEHRLLAEEFCDFMSGQTARFIRRLDGLMRGSGRGAGVRAGRPAPGRHQGAAAGAGEAGRGARRRHRLRRDRAGRGPARGGRAGVLRARRPGPRAARLGRGQGRGRHPRGADRAVPRPGVRRRPGRGPGRGGPGGGGPRRGRSWRVAARRAGPGRTGRGGQDRGRPGRAPGDPGPGGPAGRRPRWRPGWPSGAAGRSACGCRSAATRRRCWTRWPGTPPSRWRCTRPAGPAT